MINKTTKVWRLLKNKYNSYFQIFVKHAVRNSLSPERLAAISARPKHRVIYITSEIDNNLERSEIEMVLPIAANENSHWTAQSVKVHTSTSTWHMTGGRRICAVAPHHSTCHLKKITVTKSLVVSVRDVCLCDFYHCRRSVRVTSFVPAEQRAN